MQIRVFRTVDGAPITGSNVVPFAGCSWSQSLNEAGQLSFTVPASRPLVSWGARKKLRPWYASVALIDGDRIVHAGPVLSRSWSLTGGLNVTVGGVWDLFTKRLVLNYRLDALWRDGDVLIDEENPSPEWELRYVNQSLGSIGGSLVREALKWGPLLVDEPAFEIGIHERTYNGWDFATTADRLTDLTGVINGPRISFDPYIRADGFLRARYRAETGAGDEFRLSTVMEGHGVLVEDIDEDGGSLASEVYALGGRSEDIVLAARSRSSVLTGQGYPVMQEALKSHASVSRLSTLQDHVNQRVLDGSTVPESSQLRVRRSHGVRPGDVLQVALESSYHGRVDLAMNVVEVSGGVGEWVTVTAFPEVGV